MSPLALIGACIIGVGSILHIVGMATDHWTEYKIRMRYYGVVKGHSGVFGDCINDDCPSSIEAVRAFCVIGILLALGAIALIVLTQIVQAFQNMKFMPFLWLAASLGAFGSVILAIIIYGAKVQNDELDLLPNKNLGYSFYLPIVGALAMAGGGIVAFIGHRQSSRS